MRKNKADEKQLALVEELSLKVKSGEISSEDALELLRVNTDEDYLRMTPDSELTSTQRRIKEIQATTRITSKDLNVVIR